MPGAAARACAALGVELDAAGFHGIGYLDGRTLGRGPVPLTAPGSGCAAPTLQAALADAARPRRGVRGSTGGSTDDPAGRPVGCEAAGLTARYLVAADGLHSTVRRGRPRAGMPSGSRPRCGPAPALRGRAVDGPGRGALGGRARRPTSPRSVDGAGRASPCSPPARAPFADQLPAFPRAGRPAGRRRAGDPRARQRAAAPDACGAGSQGRVLLVGDAAGYVDALTGEGIAVGLACARALVAAWLADRPDGYERAWRRSSRRYRLLTRGVLLASSQPRLRAAVVPAAEAMPGAFRRLVDALA